MEPVPYIYCIFVYYLCPWDQARPFFVLAGRETLHSCQSCPQLATAHSQQTVYNRLSGFIDKSMEQSSVVDCIHLFRIRPFIHFKYWYHNVKNFTNILRTQVMNVKTTNSPKCKVISCHVQGTDSYFLARIQTDRAQKVPIPDCQLWHFNDM